MGLTIYDNQGRPKRSVRGPSVPLDAVHLVGAAGEPAFVNSWVNYDNSAATPGTAAQRNARFRKDANGKVRLAGIVKSGVSAGIFTLPVGYRPPSNVTFTCEASGGMAGVQADPNGLVSAFNHTGASVAAYVFLDGVEFDTESVLAMPGGPMGPIGTPPRVTALPASPYDGQECYFVANAANGVLWHLRYNAASSSPLKWEVVGGPPLYNEYLSLETFNSFGANAWGGITVNDPQVVVPLAGDYIARQNATLTANAQGTLFLGTRVGATDPSTLTSTWVYNDPDHISGGAPVTERRKLLAVPAGTTIRQRYQTSNAANLSRGAAALEVEPVRVG